MNRPDEDGAEAASRYFLSLYSYVYATGDLREWNALSADECVFCASVVDNVTELHADGGYQTGGEIHVERISVSAPAEGNPYFRVDIDLNEAPSVQVAGDGTRSKSPGGKAALILALAPTDGAWTIREGQVEE